MELTFTKCKISLGQRELIVKVPENGKPRNWLLEIQYKTNINKKPNELQKISLGILLAAVITLGAIPTPSNYPNIT